MTMKYSTFIFVFLLIAISTNSHMSYAKDAKYISLEGDVLRKTVSGNTVFLSVAFGVELPIRYQASGKMSGKLGEIVKIVDRKAPLKDKGRWWVKQDQLCQRWQNWLDGKAFCYRLQKVSATRIRWKRNDGKTGVARIMRH